MNLYKSYRKAIYNMKKFLLKIVERILKMDINLKSPRLKSMISNVISSQLKKILQKKLNVSESDVNFQINDFNIVSVQDEKMHVHLSIDGELDYDTLETILNKQL